ncbi:MAG: TraR/DksA family transcriptional regulator [Planctomycetota bacterium]|nr:TraR/DksA family transcriptional regulator [Planctomycetota bacterium]
MPGKAGKTGKAKKKAGRTGGSPSPARARSAPPPKRAKAAERSRGAPGARPGAAGKAERKKSRTPLPLTKEQIEEIRDALLAKLGDLKRNIDNGVQGTRERNVVQIQDQSDMATEAAEGDMILRIVENESATIAEVKKALEKIENGTYGICEACGEPIGMARLQFLPFATLCIECTKHREMAKARDEGAEIDWEAVEEADQQDE